MTLLSTNKKEIIWGISANSHDAALAVFYNNDILFASHAERFSGVKNDPHLNQQIVDYAKRWGNPDRVVWYEKPFKKTLRQLYAGQGLRLRENNIKRYLKQWGINVPISYSSHHKSHAAAGYYTSPFKDATIIVVDSIGEWETLTIWEGQGSKLSKVYSQGYPHSLGLWYSAMTQRVGLKPNEDEYILMGMAAYGNKGAFEHYIEDDFFDNTSNKLVGFKQNLHRGCKDWRTTLKYSNVDFHIAAATQHVYETKFLEIVAHARKITKSKNVVLMGGCALNCSANPLAYRHFDNVWIMPNPGDAGSAVGAVLAQAKQHTTWPGPYLGYSIYGTYPVEQALEELKTNGIVGIANGPAEYGPRALGNRSLLADPRGPIMKDVVNEIKQRQRFRPFAPVILEEHAEEYFSGPVGPYMQFTARCRQPEKFPAIIHADGTSRVQTVSKTDHPGLRQLLERWYEQTGCPMLLNTSLNIKGQPMVNNERDARLFEDAYSVRVLTGSN